MVAPNADHVVRWRGAQSIALLRSLRSRCAALRADAVQDTWLRVLKSPPPREVANDDARLRAWLARIARCREIDLKRRDRSPAPLSGSEVARDFAERDERTQLVRAALDVLTATSAAAAQLLERHYLDELPVRELAKELDLNSRVVSARLSRAKKKLRAILEDRGGVAILERIRKKFGIARRISPHRATSWCPRSFNRRFTMTAKRKLAGTALLLALLVCTMGASTSSIDYDKGQPNPNPGGQKFILEGKGPFTVDPNEESPTIFYAASIPNQSSATLATTNNNKWSANLMLAPNTYDVKATMNTFEKKTGKSVETVTATVKIKVN